jgi:hypothetical protein
MVCRLKTKRFQTSGLQTNNLWLFSVLTHRVRDIQTQICPMEKVSESSIKVDKIGH